MKRNDLTCTALLLSFVFVLIGGTNVACQSRERNTRRSPTQNKSSNDLPPPDLSRFFKDTTGAFVLYDQKQNRYVRYNEIRCKERFNPKSTFKIPNTLIGLESNVIRDADFMIAWDKQKYPQTDWGQGYPFERWAQDQTLRTAFRHSVVWYYRELALRVGKARMKEWLAKFAYGDEKIGERVDSFWLDGSLRISADEQVEFLKRFYTERLSVAKRTTQIAKDVFLIEQTPAYKLSAKTGGGSKSGTGRGELIGWFVGYVERGEGEVTYFALNIDGANYAAIRDKRSELTKQILTELGYLPKN